MEKVATQQTGKAEVIQKPKQANGANPQDVILLCGHGSRHTDTQAEFIGFTKKTARLVHPLSLDYAFLEFNHPPISKKLEELYQKGYRNFACVPVMLSAGAHVSQDIPELLAEFLANNPKAKGKVAGNFGEHQKVIAVATARTKAVLNSHNLNPKTTSLLIVGRGNLNQALNKIVQSIGNQIAAHCGMAKSMAAFCGMSKPRSDEALEALATQQTEQNVVVLPYLIFNGILLERLHHQVATANAKMAKPKFYCADRLGADDAICQVTAQNAICTLTHLG